ncbi:unnamed protein product [Musa banksii]
MQHDKVSDDHVYAYLRYLEAAGREHELRQLRHPEKQRTKLPFPTYWSSSCSFSPASSQLIRTIQAMWSIALEEKKTFIRVRLYLYMYMYYIIYIYIIYNTYIYI